MKINKDVLDKMLDDEYDDVPETPVRKLRKQQEELQFKKPDLSKLRDLKRNQEDTPKRK
jgi:hypothetical protein